MLLRRFIEDNLGIIEEVIGAIFEDVGVIGDVGDGGALQEIPGIAEVAGKEEERNYKTSL